MHEAPKTLRERLFHAVAYEIVALLLCTPLFAWIMHAPMERMGALNLAISAVAMIWNMLFNALYERLLRRFALRKTAWVRMAHGLGFEGGLALLTVPLAAWWLELGWWQALLLDAGILLFFLPYTVLFNWVYDRLRARWLARRAPGK